MFNVEMVICVGETPVDREYAVSKIELNILLTSSNNQIYEFRIPNIYN